MIGVDFCFPEAAHVICALNLETIADHDQVLGRGTRKAGASTTGSLIIPKDQAYNIKAENIKTVL